MLKLGIDEAGRGPVLGPLVIAGCLIDEKNEEELKKLGVKDSKMLTRKRREFLENKIKEVSENFEIIIVPPTEIDEKNGHGINLNYLEAFVSAEIINRINKEVDEVKVIVDCPSPNILSWRELIKSKVVKISNINLLCEHKADQNHIATSAASILAKCTRDREMDSLRQKYGEVGSGYCHDPVTIKFVSENIKKYDKEGIFRKTWETWRIAISKASQKSLNDF